MTNIKLFTKDDLELAFSAGYDFAEDSSNNPDNSEFVNNMVAMKQLPIQPTFASSKDIEVEIFKCLDSLPYEGGYPSNWKQTLANHLSEWLNKLSESTDKRSESELPNVSGSLRSSALAAYTAAHEMDYESFVNKWWSNQ